MTADLHYKLSSLTISALFFACMILHAQSRRNQISLTLNADVIIKVAQ